MRLLTRVERLRHLEWHLARNKHSASVRSSHPLPPHLIIRPTSSALCLATLAFFCASFSLCFLFPQGLCTCYSHWDSISLPLQLFIALPT